MMKKTISSAILLLAIILISCEHKDLCYDHPHYNEVNIIIHWDKNEEYIPKQGMRTHLDLIEGDYRIGVTDMPSHGTKMDILPQNSYQALCYDYMGGGSNYFKNEENFEQAEVYTNEVSRASYSKLYPNEKLIRQPENFFMDHVARFDVVRPPRINELHFYPTNRVEHYTFEIRNVRGIEHITSFAGACSGISRSYYLSKESISDDPYTVLLYEVIPIKDTNTIEGEFLIFGHCKDTQIPHHFTMEVAFVPDGYRYKTWDVTDQMHNGSHHLIMEWDIDIPIPPGTGTGMDVEVVPWDEVWIPIEM